MNQIAERKSLSAQIKVLQTKFQKAVNDFDEIERIFIAHAKSDFLDSYLENELSFIVKKGLDYSIKARLGHSALSLINSKNFDYTLSLRTPFENRSPTIRWMGISQIFSVKGMGSIRVRISKVPQNIQINNFEQDVEIQTLDEVELFHGDTIAGEGPQKVLEIIEVKSNVLVESLSVKNDKADISWNFNSSSKSFLAESSKVLMSRISTLLNVAIQMNSEIPKQLYETIFSYGDPHLKLKAIKVMLLKGDHSVFDYIEDSINSPDKILSDGAQNILDGLIERK